MVNEVVVAKKHNDSDVVVGFNGPFDSVEKAKKHRDALAIHNNHLVLCRLEEIDV